jgi:hypothetical protein
MGSCSAEGVVRVGLRSRVKIARAVVSKMPGLAAILRERPDRAARFYARFGITEAQLAHGVPSESRLSECEDLSVFPEIRVKARPRHGCGRKPYSRDE